MWEEGDEETGEQVSADFGDAYLHLAIHHKELKHCIVRQPEQQQKKSRKALGWGSAGRRQAAQRQAKDSYKLLPMVSFGSKGAPLVWSRIAAAIGRLTAAMMRRRRGRVQIYLDDPLLHLVGNRQQRCKLLSCVLLVWAACGFRIAWHKGQRGGELDWIGLLFSVDQLQRQIIIRCTTQMAEDIKKEIEEMMAKPMIALKPLK